MLNIKELEEMGKKAGFSYVALLKSDSIQLMPEVREMCKNNTCHMYAKRWSCPPGCGDLEVCRKKIEKYREGIIVQTVGKLEDPLDGVYISGCSMPFPRTGIFFDGSLWNAGNTGMPGKWSGILLWSLYDRLYQLLSS